MVKVDKESIMVSVVLPTLNEEANVADIAVAVKSALIKANVTHELIFIDNGSTDRTTQIVRELCREDSTIKLIINTRNFGQMRSPTHAIYQASGNAVIAMCADFQDPPELIPEFIERWKAGLKIVLGVRRREKSSWQLRAMRSIGYGFLKRFGDHQVISGATGFGLYDREVINVLAGWNEPEPFFRGMLMETGFSFAAIPYVRPQRSKGESKNNFRSLISFSLSAATSSSNKLLRLPIFFGVTLFSIGTAALIISTVVALIGKSALLFGVLGFFSIVFGLLFLFIGVLGEQVRLMAERTRNIPLVIEKERVNF